MFSDVSSLLQKLKSEKSSKKIISKDNKFFFHLYEMSCVAQAVSSF